MAVELTKEEEKTEWYLVLGLESTADDAAISKAFKKLSLRWHPDKNQGSKDAEKMFMMVKEAKIFLLDAKKRKTYDEKRNARLKAEAQLAVASSGESQLFLQRIQKIFALGGSVLRNLHNDTRKLVELAEQYRSMGQKRRQLREELERREKGVVNGVRSGGSGSVCLGAGGEARLVSELKKRGEEMRKRQGREREQKRREQEAAMESEFERASAKKRRDGSNDDDYDFEDRTVRVKWSTKKESHSDHTLDVLFSRFGVVELVSIEAGTGNKALVTFALPTAADAAVAHFNEDHETMRASHASKKKRAKRNSFAPRRESFMSPPGTPMSEGGGSVASTPSSLRDKESLVMMKLRREAERQALIRQMAADEGISVEQAGGSKPPPVSPAVATPSGASRTNSQRNASANGDTNGKEADRDEAGNGESTATEGGETNQRAAAAAVGVVNCSTSNLEVGGDGGAGIGERGKEQQLKQPTSSSVSPTGTNSIRSSTVTPVFPYPSPRTPAAGVGRDSAKLSSMKRGVAGSSPLSTPIGAGIGFNTRMGVNSAGADDMRRVSTPTVMAAGGSTPSSSAGESPLDEGDILARMMRFK